MSRFRETCKVTHRPRRWVKHQKIVTFQCIYGECLNCNRDFVGTERLNKMHYSDLWSNEYSICQNANESELLTYA